MTRPIFWKIQRRSLFRPNYLIEGPRLFVDFFCTKSFKPNNETFFSMYISHISHIYKGKYTMFTIKPHIFWIKIFVAIFLAQTRPSFSVLGKLEPSPIWALLFLGTNLPFFVVVKVNLISSIWMPPTFPIASLNRYTPNFSGVPQKLTWCQQCGLQIFPKWGDAHICPQKNAVFRCFWTK